MKILWITFVWPEPASSAGGVRTSQLLEASRAAGWEVHVCSPCLPSSHRSALEDRGIPTAHFKPNDSEFDVYVRALQPDVVFFDRFMIEEQFSWRVRAQCPEALRVLDTIDLHSVRRLREKQLDAGNTSIAIQDADLLSDDGIRELSAIYRSDLSLVVSDFEHRLLLERYHVPPDQIALCRIFYPVPQAGLDFSERTHFVMIGNFRHAPNLDGYRVLQRGLWQKIRSRLPIEAAGAELHIYGAYPNKELMDLDDPATGFRVKGWADDVHRTLAGYRVNLAPLRFGAGIKGKILDGWSVGLPCASTPIGAEGIHEGTDFGGSVSTLDSEGDEFAKCAAALYSDQALWERSRRHGLSIIRDRFDGPTIIAGFITRIERLVANRSKSRELGFVSAMLWHHGARSTEYFSRWIESKTTR